MSNIEKLKNIQIIGNYYSDTKSGFFPLADKIALDETESMENRIAALQLMDVAMGMEGEVTEADVQNYVNECS